MIRLAIITSHPIQYNAPLFKRLSANTSLDVKVFYTLGKDYCAIKDKGFGKTIAWDIPLLEGYDYEFLVNQSKKPGTNHFKGIINNTIIHDIQVYRPTAILVFGWSFVSHLKVLRRFKKNIPIYFRGDSTLLDSNNVLKGFLRKLFLQWVYSHVDTVFYVGSSNKHYFKEHGVREQNLVFAPHAIDNERFGDDKNFSVERELLKSRLGIPENEIVFLFVGKFEMKKSPMLLIKAFKKLCQDKINLVLVGDGILEHDLKEEAGQYSNIHFLPFQNQVIMPAVYRIGDVLVLPSSGPGETWGLCVNEAMACSLAVIVSNKVGCSTDLLKENMNGFVFEANDIDSLVKKLTLCAVKSKDELKAMGLVSSEIIKNWSYERTCAAMVSILYNNKG
jgi:glycosyltransferase involved in cell wall biosynthesis